MRLATFIHILFNCQLENSTLCFLQLAPVMAKMDRFWIAYPKNHPVYTRLQNNIPLRSIKTMLTIICKHMGQKVRTATSSVAATGALVGLAPPQPKLQAPN